MTYFRSEHFNEGGSLFVERPSNEARALHPRQLTAERRFIMIVSKSSCLTVRDGIRLSTNRIRKEWFVRPSGRNFFRGACSHAPPPVPHDRSNVLPPSVRSRVSG